MEVIALKKGHQEQEAELKYEIDRLKDQLKKAREEFAKEQQKSKKVRKYKTTPTHATLVNTRAARYEEKVRCAITPFNIAMTI